jgi:hypothetical protein
MQVRALLVVLSAAAVVLPVPSAVALSAGAADGPQPTLLDVVVVVDESGSLSDDDVHREVDAVRYIALGSGLNPASRVTVIGFGSENGSGKSAIDVVCPPSIVGTSAERAAVNRCVNGLHRRTVDEGNDTDQATALTQALSYFDSSPLKDAQRTVFLLTDGLLDVTNSPKFGAVRENRNETAMNVVEEQLKRAARLGVQVWPLGFGRADGKQLQTFAAGASSKECSEQTGPPLARVIHNSSDLQGAVLEAFRRAVCVNLVGPVEKVVGPGTSADIVVKVPAIATDGTILVSKGDKRIAVTYLDSDENKIRTQGESGGSMFSLSGQDSETESLRITNPRPGKYIVHVEAGKDLGNQLVKVVALWQGAVRAALYTDPATALPGQRVAVHVSLHSRSGPITSAEALEGIAVSATMGKPGAEGALGKNAAPVVTVPLRNDGQGDDPTAGDGQFSGSLTAPDTPGRRQLTAFVTGPGIHAEPLVTTLSIQQKSMLVLADFSFDLPEKVLTGESITGKVSIVNNTSAPVPAKFELRDANGLVSLQGPQTLTLQPGQNTLDVKLATARGGPTGVLGAQLSLVNADDPTLTYGSAALRTQVSGPPSIWERWFWGFLAGGVVLLAALFFLGLRWFAVLQHRRVQGLTAQIIDTATGRVARSVRASSGWAQTMRFVVVRSADASSVNPPQLMGPSTRQGARYSVRRRGGGKVLVSVAGGGTEELTLGQDMLLLDDPRYVLRIVESVSGPSGTSYGGGGGGGWRENTGAFSMGSTPSSHGAGGRERSGSSNGAGPTCPTQPIPSPPTSGNPYLD